MDFTLFKKTCMYFWETCTMRTINWIFTIFHGKDDKHYLNIVNVFTVCLFNALNIYVCSGPYIRRRFCQYHKAKCYSIVNACHVYSSLLIQPFVDLQSTSNFWLLQGCCPATGHFGSWHCQTSSWPKHLSSLKIVEKLARIMHRKFKFYTIIKGSP